jgi:hypothetical protein
MQRAAEYASRPMGRKDQAHSSLARAARALGFRPDQATL